MTSAVMETEDASIGLENGRIAGLESQILNSQEVIVRLNRELDSALLRISTLDNVCSENQNDLHEKRTRIKELNDQIETGEQRLDQYQQELADKDEKLENLNDLILQLKEHIKQTKRETEEDNQYQLLLQEYGSPSITDLRSQIKFDRQLSKLVLEHLDHDPNWSPQDILRQYDQHQRVQFHELLQQSLIAENVSDLIAHEDILFESLTHLNNLSRLKETLSHDSEELQHIRSLLRLSKEDDMNASIEELLNKRESMEYLRTKIDQQLPDVDLIQHVLHDYFDYQQQQMELKANLHLEDDGGNDLNYAQLLIERHREANDIGVKLQEQITSNEQTSEQLQQQLNDHSNQRRAIEEMASEFGDPQPNEETEIQPNAMSAIRSILQSNKDFRDTIFSEFAVTSNEDILQLLHQDKSNPLHVIEDQHSKVEELTNEIIELKEEANQRRNLLNELLTSLRSDNDEDASDSDRNNPIADEIQFNLIRSTLQSSTRFQLTLAEKLSVANSTEAILQRLDDYQMVTDQLNWTNESAEEFVQQLNVMKNAEKTLEDQQKQFEDVLQSQKQLQNDIEQLVNEFLPPTNDDEESNIVRLRQLLTNQRQAPKEDVQSQTTDVDDFHRQIQNLLGMEENNDEEMIQKVSELVNTQTKEVPSTNEKLRNLFDVDEDDLEESVIRLHDNFRELKEKHEELLTKTEMVDQSIDRMLDKAGFTSDSPFSTRIDEICGILDTFSREYRQLISSPHESMSLNDIFQHIQEHVQESNRLQTLINRIDANNSLKSSDYASQLETYLTKVETLCELIGDPHISIDQALVVYQDKIKRHEEALEKVSKFKQQLLTHLSINHEERIFDRLAEIEQINLDLKEKAENTDATTALNVIISEQGQKILEHEDTLEKLRSQRERMLNKMKEMKTNNETTVTQLKQVQQTVDDFHRKEISYKNQIEELEQQLRSNKTQMQVTLDECRTQQDFQETMKLEIESIKNGNETQRKLYESRCRQIINEKNQLEKARKELVEQKHILEDENKRFQSVLQSIQDTLENVDDVHTIADSILKLRHEHLSLTNELQQRNKQIENDNNRLSSNIDQQQKTLDEYVKTRMELEKQVDDNEQQLQRYKQELEDRTRQYQLLQNEYQLFRDDQQRIKDSKVAVINVEQSSPPPPPSVTPQPHLLAVQQAAQSNNWMTIDMKDDEITPPTINKHSPLDAPTALFNLLGELKSKLGITLTHRPRSSSAFFFYLCAVHLLTIYLLFRHC